MLLTHESDARVCVLELKKGSTSDRAVGQLLRYVGWVRQHLPELQDVDAEAEVEGRLVVSQPSEKLEYAISAVSELELYRYEMEVSLVRARPD
jgi:RecB family endonuclease NucS